MMTRNSLFYSSCLLLSGLVTSLPASAFYIQRNLVANDVKYCTANVEPALVDAWGIAIRPAGLGGHFWVTSNGGGSSLEYVGDVNGRALYQDALKVVGVPGPNSSDGTPTGVVFNRSNKFVITQAHANGPITAAAKFLFVTDNGVISAWTERAKAGGGFDWPGQALAKIDRSAQGSQFFGLGVSNALGRMYVADFGKAPSIRVYDGNFQDISTQIVFRNPFANSGGPMPGDFVPFNVQVLDDAGTERVFVTYTKSQNDPDNPGHILPGEEDSAAGNGRLVEYDVNGNLLSIWEDRGLLNSPWGLAIAPTDFARNDNTLLVSNFGDGTVVAFDRTTHKAIDYLRDAYQSPIELEGVWGLQFGNGASLGEVNNLYFAAGPNDEKDGVFGKLIPFTYRNPNAKAELALWQSQHKKCLKFVDGSWQIRTCAIPCNKQVSSRTVKPFLQSRIQPITPYVGTK